MLETKSGKAARQVQSPPPLQSDYRGNNSVALVSGASCVGQPLVLMDAAGSGMVRLDLVRAEHNGAECWKSSRRNGCVCQQARGLRGGGGAAG